MRLQDKKLYAPASRYRLKWAKQQCLNDDNDLLTVTYETSTYTAVLKTKNPPQQLIAIERPGEAIHLGPSFLLLVNIDISEA